MLSESLKTDFTAWLIRLVVGHMFCQFYVSNPEGEGGRRPALSCQLYQRSCDVGLGVVRHGERDTRHESGIPCNVC